MRKHGLLGVLFFIAIQAAIFVSLKRFHSFAESKWFLASSEGLLVLVTIAIYTLSQPTPKPRRPRPSTTTETPPPPKEQEQLLKTANDEKNQLSQTLQRLQESELFAKQRTEDLERKSTELSTQLAETAANLLDAQRTTDSCCQTIQTLTFEVDRLTTQLDQERRQHSIEIRTLLGKESESSSKKKVPRTLPTKSPLQPIPSLLLLLSACQKGLDLHVANDWPANEHRTLVRRKFFDVAQKMGLAPIAIVSLESPTEHFLSPKLPGSLSIADLRAAVLPYKTTFERLKRFEPYHITDERLGGRWIVFRAAWDNLEDLVALAPANP